MNPLISVIITTKNEERNIENCIKSILNQNYPKDKVEIIVVDNNSTDRTKEIARKYTGKVFDLSEEINLKNVKNFRGAQLNFGVERSNGKIIFFPDSDMTFSLNLFYDIEEKIKKNDALFVPEIVCGSGFLGKIRNFERNFYNMTCVDALRAVKKEIFLENSGFDTKNILFGADDWDFTKTLKKNGCRLGITDVALYHHEERMSWKTHLSKKTNYFVTFDAYIAKWGKNDPDIKKQFGIYYRFLGVFIEKGKWKKIIAHPVLAIGMIFLKILVGANFLKYKFFYKKDTFLNYEKNGILSSEIPDEIPLISVIITTRNEEKNIGNCLKSIYAQSYPKDKIEIIVVDNDSTDRTKEIAKKYTDKVLNKGPERSAQRNFGVENSNGDYFLYLDADMTLDNDVIIDCIKKINEKKEFIALYVSEIVTGNKFWSKTRRFERSFYDGTVIDCVRFVKKESFQKVGGFDENLTGPEDWDFDKKIRNLGGVALIKTPIYHNEKEFDLKKYINKKGYYAKKFDAYIFKWGKNDPDIKKQFGIYYRFLGVFIEKGKWKKIVRHPFLNLGVYFLRIMVGVKFLFRK